MKERKTYLDIIRSSSVLIIVLFHFSCLLEDFNYKGYNNFFLHYANGKWGRVYRPPKVRPKNLTIGGRYFYG